MPATIAPLPSERADSMSARMWAEPEWRVTPGLVSYPDALGEMEVRVQAVADGKARELVWLLQHPPIYTGGTSAVHKELLEPDRFPVFRTGRGGRFTYHGPGQRIGYLVLDLGHRGRDVRRFVQGLEAWLIAALGRIGLQARAVPGRVGIWVEHPTRGEAKIGAIGVRIRRWVTFHGFSLNVDPVLEHFSGIVPCGLAEFPVTSLADLGIDVGMGSLDAALRGEWPDFLRNLASNAGNS